MRLPKNKKIYFTLAASLILVVIVVLAWPNKKATVANSGAAISNGFSPQPTNQVSQPGFNRTQHSTDEAASLWVIVNKGRALPSTYVPANLVAPSVPLRTNQSDPEMHVRSDTAGAMEKMFAAAKADGINLMLSSGYRSYAEQVSLYNSYASQYGAQEADTFSARPGHSEHQTGLAADIEPVSRNCEVAQCFESTPEGRWLAANCYKFGFVIRYQKATQSLTGYEYEPWHVRYIGDGLAQQLQNTGQTLEQFFGLPAYTDYPASSYELKT